MDSKNIKNRFSYEAFIFLTDEERKIRCDNLACLLSETFLPPPGSQIKEDLERNIAVKAIVRLMKELGHDMYQWSDSPDEDDWGFNNWVSGSFGLLIEITYPDDITVYWREQGYTFNLDKNKQEDP